jgi:hypothetical protein
MQAAANGGMDEDGEPDGAAEMQALKADAAAKEADFETRKRARITAEFQSDKGELVRLHVPAAFKGASHAAYQSCCVLIPSCCNMYNPTPHAMLHCRQLTQGFLQGVQACCGAVRCGHPGRQTECSSRPHWQSLGQALPV